MEAYKKHLTAKNIAVTSKRDAYRFKVGLFSSIHQRLKPQDLVIVNLHFGRKYQQDGRLASQRHRMILRGTNKVRVYSK